MLSDQDFMRYSRQLLLEEIGPQGQEKLSTSSVLIVGLGGLGTPAAMYLAAAGIGKIILADGDRLHISNLQRQILYRTADLGRSKVETAKHHLRELNPQVELITLPEHLECASLAKAIAHADLILDCSDNMPTRQAVNAACVAQAKPLISGSAVGFGGQLMVIEPPYDQGCYRCLWPDDIEPQRNCRNAGVLGPVVGVIGTLQALEAIKMLAGIPSALSGKLRLFDGRQQSWRTFSLKRSPTCPVCGGIAA